VAQFEALKQDTKTLSNLAKQSIEKADVVLIVVDAAREISDNYKITFSEIVRVALQYAKQEIILVLNKVDLVTPKTKLLEITWELVSLINGIKLGPENAHNASLDTTTFMVSAIENDGIIDLKNYLISVSQPKSWIIKKMEGITDWTPEQRVEEVILEKLLDHTHEEIPYIAEITCTSIEPLNSDRIKIETTVMVNNNRQQRIVIGQQGRTLVKIRQDAVADLEKLFNKQVILMINIRVSDEPKMTDQR